VSDKVMSWDGQRPLRGLRAALLRPLWGQVDWPIFFVAVLLLLIGITFQAAMSAPDEEIASPSVFAHLTKVAVALPALFAGLLVRPRWLRRNAYLVYAASVGLLLLVPLIGDVRNNARRWIELPLGFDLQPSELAKVALVVALSAAFYRNRLQRPRDWALPALLALVPMALVAKQPDLGTARARTLCGIVLLGALALGLAWRFSWIEDYQKERVDTWIQAFDADSLIEDKQGASFHACLSRMMIGRGSLFGRGLGQGISTQTGHLPERESDSIFAVIAEETGLLGATGLLGVYLALIGLILRRAGQVRERFSRLVVGGVALVYTSHVGLHCAVMLGLLPLTGLTLPFVSTGGSALLTACVALGLALGLGTHHERALDSDSFRS
jgi:rod shape determining protein RodA